MPRHRMSRGPVVLAVAFAAVLVAAPAPSEARSCRQILVYTANVNMWRGSGLYRASADGSHPVAILADDGATDVFLPRVSPRGTRVAAVVGRPALTYALRIVRADGTGMTTVEPQQVTRRLRTYITGVSWAPDGRTLVYGVTSGLVGTDTTWDMLRTVNTSGTPKPVTLAGSTGLSMPAYDPTGRTIAAVEVRGAGTRVTFTLVLFDPASRARRPVFTSTTAIGQPTWSPDGRRLAWAMETGTGRVIIVLDNATGRRTTVAGGRNAVNDHPYYAPDGRLWFDRSFPPAPAGLWTLGHHRAPVRVTPGGEDESTPSLACK